MVNVNSTDSVVTIVSSSSSSSNDGPELQPHLHVHEQQLFASSPVLKQLAEPTSAGGIATRLQISRIELDVPYEGLRNLSHWLYHREYPLKTSEDLVDDKMSSQIVGFIHSYHVGEKLQIVDFADACADSMLQLLETQGDLGCLAKVMPAVTAYIQADSRIRRLIVDWIVRAECSSKSAVDNSVWQAFMSDQHLCGMLLDAFYRRKLEHQVCLHHVEGLHKLTPCVYHWHAELGKPCYRQSEAGARVDDTSRKVHRDQQPIEVATASHGVGRANSAERTFVEV
ncbi:hypothetical protein CERZMDRAFT_98481 [Cercospora zeae-maydis SCOH1-5]|uniref:BTB domain-containing protein n=1 Tax=Cercospora zeae-maydis SCOH1-5 TaxID=717836 RepID=A0A6A6FDR8_9PEZI|nr:hypothetical protein CERZMDRAFT_98481 [Cercospora zeae-maydis SCOH1-5]